MYARTHMHNICTYVHMYVHLCACLACWQRVASLLHLIAAKVATQLILCSRGRCMADGGREVGVAAFGSLAS